MLLDIVITADSMIDSKILQKVVKVCKEVINLDSATVLQELTSSYPIE